MITKKFFTSLENWKKVLKNKNCLICLKQLIGKQINKEVSLISPTFQSWAVKVKIRNRIQPFK